MPLLNDNLDSHNLPDSHIGYTAPKIDNLGSAEYTLVTIVVDCSSSVSLFKQDLENCLKEVVKSCKLSPRAESLMIRIVTFNSSYQELHGFKLLDTIDIDDYTDSLNPYGMTALFDATRNAIEAEAALAKTLVEEEFDVNGLIVVITDGDDNSSIKGADSVKEARAKIIRAEDSLESLLTILIGVGIDSPHVVDFLEDFKNTAQIDQFINAGDANEKTLAKIAGFISKSISAQSNALNSGAISQPIGF